MSRTELNTDLLQLMASKICHDLISPVGAIANGMEFLEEMGPEAFDDAKDLIGHSATQASAKLKAYRIAYGMGGADSTVKPEDVHAAIDGMIAGDGRITQDWDASAPMGVDASGAIRLPAFGKVLICALIYLMDALPKGGVLSVSADGGVTSVTATGENAALREGQEEGLALTLANDQLEPKHTHAVLTGMLFAQYEYRYEVTQDQGSVSLSFSPAEG